jgi:hypothetical protein
MISPSMAVSSGSFWSATAIPAKRLVKSLPLRDSNRTLPSPYAESAIAVELQLIRPGGSLGQLRNGQREHWPDQSDADLIPILCLGSTDNSPHAILQSRGQSPETVFSSRNGIGKERALIHLCRSDPW